MKADVERYKPFRDHFLMLHLGTTATQADADCLETLCIATLDATGPMGYNTLKGPPRTTPAYYAMQASRAKRTLHPQ